MTPGNRSGYYPAGILSGSNSFRPTPSDGATASPSQAQMLARVGHPPARIASESGVSASEAQYLVRRISMDR